MNIRTALFQFVLFASMLFSSCINREKKPESFQGVRGDYVNNTVLKKIADTVPGGVPHFCFEMHFFCTDSVDIDDGISEYKFAYKKQGSNFVLLKPTWKGDMLFTLNPDSSITMMDTAWTGIAASSEFKKVPENKEHKWVFDYYLNEQMIAGEYFLYKDDKPTQQKIIFTTDGRVIGLENFVSYYICYSGDCVGETTTPSNTIDFTSSSKTQTSFAFKIDKKNKILNIYSLEAPKEKDIKGELIIKDKIFDLRIK